MSIASLFQDFRKNLSVSNASDISTKYCNITCRLNKDFWDSDSDTLHSLQIGSYGRHTAIDGVSDLDMVFQLPAEAYERYKNLEGNGPSVMLQEVRESLLKRYSTSEVKADGQIVGVNFVGYRVEVLPGILDVNGDYIYGDTNDGGKWKTTKPRPEIKAVNDLDADTNGTLKDVCKMLRAWKNQKGVGIGGLLIDTLVYNFFVEHVQYNNVSYGQYPELLVSLFSYLGGLPAQDYWLAPGSNQRVKCKAKFQAKARKAAARCQEAVDEGEEGKKATLWRKVFGAHFPKAEELSKIRALSFDQEQFIEDKFPVDIRYNIELDCEIREGNSLQDLLRQKLRLKQKVPIGRHMRFYVSECNIPGHFDVWWKVRNRGPEAIERKMLRGEIHRDKDSRMEQIETSDFAGSHYVEVYAVQNGVCVARERIGVPI